MASSVGAGDGGRGCVAPELVVVAAELVVDAELRDNIVCTYLLSAKKKSSDESVLRRPRAGEPMRYHAGDDHYYSVHGGAAAHEDSSDEDSGGCGVGGTKYRYERDPEVWQDYYSEELVQLFHAAVDAATARGLPILDKCTFHDFATFCFATSSGVVPR